MACTREAARDRDRAWMITIAGIGFFGLLAIATVSTLRHRAPLDPPPAPLAPNPIVAIPAASATGSDAPFAPPTFPQTELDFAAARRGVSITIYSAVWCGYCQKAKAYMKEHDLAFIERDVDEDAANEEAMRKISPKGTIPAFDVEGEAWVGWSSARLESAVDRAAKRRLAKK
jgi:glutaredoxin